MPESISMSSLSRCVTRASSVQSECAITEISLNEASDHGVSLCLDKKSASVISGPVV